MSILTTKIRDLPHQPGCYIYKNSAGEIIYIGKAKDIRKRVGSYFSKTIIDPKTVRLISDIRTIDFIITDTEVEAFLLEAKLIKENQPKYNIDLKGGVRYAYIRITKEQFPRLETVRSFTPKDEVFGPFAVAQNRRSLIQLANGLFKLRSSKRQPVRLDERFQIQCSTPPWRRIVTPATYRSDIEKVRLLLKGKMQRLIGELAKEMKQYSDRNLFEWAKLRRDQIAALEQLKEQQKVQLRLRYDQDIISYARLADTFFVQLFTITKGVISERKKFTVPVEKTSEQPAEMLTEFLSQYYYSNEVPQEVIVPHRLTSQAVFERYLTQLAGRAVRVVVPQRGDKLKLLQLIDKNIIADLTHGDRILYELQTALNLPSLPKVIECFDISNLGAKQIVGSMVYFKNGVPDKNNYRRFKIKWQRGQSDVDAIYEIVLRRYERLKRENTPLPDLIMIDGGKPQLSAARLVLKRLNINPPIIALAKQQEEVFVPQRANSIVLSRKSEALKLLQRIRDEAHRFAITYHRLLRKKQFEQSSKNRYTNQ